MKKPFLTPTAVWITLDAQDVIRTSDGQQGLDIQEQDDEKGFGLLIPLG